MLPSATCMPRPSYRSSALLRPCNPACSLHCLPIAPLLLAASLFTNLQTQVWTEAVAWSHLLELVRNLPYICFRDSQLNVLVFLLRVQRAVKRSEALKGRMGDIEEAVAKVSQSHAASQPASQPASQ